MLLTGSVGFGFSMAHASRREMEMLRSLIRSLQEMEWELKYRMTQLPDLLRIAADTAGGNLRVIFHELAHKLDSKEAEDISGCLNSILYRFDLPKSVRNNMKQLGLSMGRYDLEGQLQGLHLIRMQCRKDLTRMEENSRQRIRNYQTLAFCAGAALVILFV